MNRYWKESDPNCKQTIDVVTQLSGVNPTAGIWNTFNDMQEAGWLNGADTNGEVRARWLAWELMEAGRLGATTRRVKWTPPN